MACLELFSQCAARLDGDGGSDAVSLSVFLLSVRVTVADGAAAAMSFLLPPSHVRL